MKKLYRVGLINVCCWVLLAALGMTLAEGLPPQGKEDDMDQITLVSRENYDRGINALKGDLGELPVVDVIVPYEWRQQAVLSNSQSYTRIEDAIGTISNTAWKIGTAGVTAGERVRIRFFTYGSNERNWVIFTKADGAIVQYAYKSSNVGMVEQRFTVPDGAERVYVGTYSSETNLPNNLVIVAEKTQTLREYTDARCDSNAQANAETAGLVQSIDEKCDGVAAASDAVIGQLRELFRYDAYWNGQILDKKMYDTNGAYIDNADNTFKATEVISVYGPTLIAFDGEARMAVNRYARISSPNSGQLLQVVRSYAEPGDVYFTAETYPAYIAVGFTAAEGQDRLAYGNAEIAARLSIRATVPQQPSAALSMFTSMAVTGCSWDAGSIYAAGGSHVSPTNLSWGDNIARRNGLACHNYAIGGTNILTWSNAENTGDVSTWRGLQGLLANDADPLIWFPWGNVNDAGAIKRGDFPLGSMADITGHADYHSYPKTFYGMVGRALEMIMEHAPGSFIIIPTGAGMISSEQNRVDVEAAMREIAAHYGLPYADLKQEPFYPEYCQWTVSNHPTAAGYSGAALMLERAFSEVVRTHHELFETYNGLIQTVPVAWTPID